MGRNLRLFLNRERMIDEFNPFVNPVAIANGMRIFTDRRLDGFSAGIEQSLKAPLGSQFPEQRL